MGDTPSPLVNFMALCGNLDCAQGKGKKSERSLGILFAMKSTIFAELPTEEYDFSYFHVLSISINFRNYVMGVTFIEMAVSTLKVLHP